MGTRLTAGHVLHPGRARAEVLRLTAPLSFWGGTDPAGRITDPHHPQRGARLAGRVVVVRASRGSSSSSSVLAEHIRRGHGPAALLLAERDAIVALGALAAAELYGLDVPVLCLDAADFAAVPAEGIVSVGEDGTVTW